MDDNVKFLQEKNYAIFTLFEQSFIYKIKTNTYFPLTDCAKDILLDEDFVSKNVVDKQIRLKYSNTEIVQTLNIIDKIINTASPHAVVNTPDHFAGRGEYTLKLIPTLRCNLNCLYCFIDKKNKDYDMSLETAKKAIDFFLDKFAAKNAKKYIIDLTGAGEPLLCLNFILAVNDYVLELKKNRKINIFCQFASNGMLLTPEVSRILKKNMILFGVSLDGEKNVCEESRHGLDYDKVISNIMNMENKQFFGLAATYSGTNHDFIKIFMSLNILGSEVIGMKPVRLPLSDPKSINKDNIKEIIKSYDLFADFIYKKLVTDDYDVFIKFIKGEDYFTRFLKIMLHPSRVYYRCDACISSIAVDAKENILICPSFVGKEETKIGTLDVGISDEIYKKFMNCYADKNFYCKGCWARYACAGECFNVAYTNNKSFLKPVDVMCELKKHLIQLAIYFWTSLRYEYPNIYDKCKNKY